MQTLPVHISHILDDSYRGATFVATCEHISVSQNPYGWRGHFYGVYMEAPQVLYSSVKGTTLKKSIIPKPDSGSKFLLLK